MRPYFSTYHEDDFTDGQYISYGSGINCEGPSACEWMIPGTWIEED